jgi:hypothetical protein
VVCEKLSPNVDTRYGGPRYSLLEDRDDMCEAKATVNNKHAIWSWLGKKVSISYQPRTWKRID